MKKIQIIDFKSKLFAARCESVDCPLSPVEFEKIRLGNLSFVFSFVTSVLDVKVTRVLIDVKVLTSILGFNSHESVSSVRLYSFEISERKVFLFWCLLNRLVKLVEK